MRYGNFFSFGTFIWKGIEIMGEVMKPMAGSPVFVDPDVWKSFIHAGSWCDVLR